MQLNARVGAVALLVAAGVITGLYYSGGLLVPTQNISSTTTRAIATAISSYFYSAQSAQTLLGYVKVLPGTASGVYFFDVGSVQYHLVFCSCQGAGICNCPNLPALSDGERIQVTGSIVTPSTYGSVLAAGGNIYVQTWTAA